MANTLKMAQTNTIRTLLEQGWSQRRIARELGIHRGVLDQHRSTRREQPDTGLSTVAAGHCLLRQRRYSPRLVLVARFLHPWFADVSHRRAIRGSSARHATEELQGAVRTGVHEPVATEELSCSCW